MRMKVAKYISEFFVKQGVTDMFMITGGAAMHLLLPDRLKERQQYGQLTFRFVSLVIRKLILHQQYLL